MTAKIVSKLLLATLILPLMLAQSPQQALAATAAKSAVGQSSYTAGQQATIQIKFNKAEVDPSVEIAVAFDTSGSMDSYLDTLNNSIKTYLNQMDPYPNVSSLAFRDIGDNQQTVVNRTPLNSTTKQLFIDAMVDHGQGSTTIERGIQEAIDTFTDQTGSDGKKRILIILTDGMGVRNKCPLAANGSPTIAVPPGTIVQVLGATNAFTPQQQETTGVSASHLDYFYSGNSYVDRNNVCKPYIDSHSKPRNYQFLNDLAAAYASSYRPFNSNGSFKDTSIKTTLDATVEQAKIGSITLSDTLNPAVFSSVGALDGVYNCTTGALLFKDPGSISWTPTGGVGFSAKITNMSVQEYCVRFKATIRSDIGGVEQTYPINTTDTTNKISYFNTLSALIAQDGIGVGSITIGANINLKPSAFHLTNSTGALKYIYTVGQAIFWSTNVRNDSAVATPSNSVTRFFKDQNQYYPGSPDSSITHGSFAASTGYDYASYPGGIKDFAYSSKSVTWNGVGKFRAMEVVNYQQASGPVKESNYADNVASFAYAVITPPSNLSASAGCNLANFTWKAGAGIDSYRLFIRNLTNPNDSSDTVAGNASSFTNKSLTEGPNNYQWWLIPRVTIDGVLRESDWVSGGTFSTSRCLRFDVSAPISSNVSPGTTGSATLTPTYLPSLAEWMAQNGKLQIGVLGIVAGTNCNSYSASSPFNGAGPGGWGANAATMNGEAIFKVYTPGNGAVYLNLKVPSTATPGSTFTVCIKAFENSSPTKSVTGTIIRAVTFRVVFNSWLQIDRPSTLGSGTGDMYTRGGFSLTVPVNKYFFAPGSAGVAQAIGSLDALINKTSNVPNKDWRVADYGSVVNTEQSQLFQTTFKRLSAQVDRIKAGRADAEQSDEDQDHGYVREAGCRSTRIGKVDASKITVSPSATNTKAVIWDGGRLSGATGSDGCPEIIQIGDEDHPLDLIMNVTMKANQVQEPIYPIIFLISGNLKVHGDVKQMNNMIFLWNKGFDDAYNLPSGTSPVQLVIRGSLIALPDSSLGFMRDNSNSGLRRSVGDNTEPGEKILFQPQYLDTLSSLFEGYDNILTWNEDGI